MQGAPCRPPHVIAWWREGAAHGRATDRQSRPGAALPERELPSRRQNQGRHRRARAGVAQRDAGRGAAAAGRRPQPRRADHPRPPRRASRLPGRDPKWPAVPAMGRAERLAGRHLGRGVLRGARAGRRRARGHPHPQQPVLRLAARDAGRHVSAAPADLRRRVDRVRGRIDRAPRERSRLRGGGRCRCLLDRDSRAPRKCAERHGA